MSLFENYECNDMKTHSKNQIYGESPDVETDYESLKNAIKIAG